MLSRDTAFQTSLELLALFESSRKVGTTVTTVSYWYEEKGKKELTERKTEIIPKEWTK